MTISYGAFCRAVKALGYTRKIIRAVAYQADRDKADAWLREVLTFHSASELGVLDETSKDLDAANRGFGYSLRGTDCTTQAPGVHTLDPHTSKAFARVCLGGRRLLRKAAPARRHSTSRPLHAQGRFRRCAERISFA